MHVNVFDVLKHRYVRFGMHTVGILECHVCDGEKGTREREEALRDSEGDMNGIHTLKMWNTTKQRKYRWCMKDSWNEGIVCVHMEIEFNVLQKIH